MRAVIGGYVLAMIGLAMAAPLLAQDGKKAYPAGVGPYAVETIDDLALTDTKRKKDLHVKIYYPKAEGPFPVIIFSHGFGDTRNAFSYLSTFWAGHGYVCLHPTHADSGQLKANAKQGAKPLQGLLDAARWIERVGDVTFLLDALPDLPTKAPSLRGRLDAGRVGVAGHSFGAYTAMLVGGVTIDVDGKKDRSYADPRVQALLPISPQGTGQQGLTGRSWQALKLPMMTVTGSRDLKPGRPADWRKEPFDRSPVGDKYEVFLEGAHHGSFGGRFGQGPITEAVKATSLAFWDAYLKDGKDGRAYLQDEGLAPLNKTTVLFRRK